MDERIIREAEKHFAPDGAWHEDGEELTAVLPKFDQNLKNLRNRLGHTFRSSVKMEKLTDTGMGLPKLTVLIQVASGPTVEVVQQQTAKCVELRIGTVG